MRQNLENNSVGGVRKVTAINGVSVEVGVVSDDVHNEFRRVTDAGGFH